jgi:hypothetical protein
MDETNADFPTLGPTSWALVCASYVWENPRELAITRLGTLGWPSMYNQKIQESKQIGTKHLYDDYLWNLW